ncbi:helix-turn-helix domain-containing protein [Brevibacillus borstelensis]|uniref:helix-turn-helix domain-containing protein n=1 Tax=Brevibacillus borstelensis TaxID=45462 RepID=UPI0030C5A617
MMNDLQLITEPDFCKLVRDAQKGSDRAIQTLLELFEPDIERLSWFIRMPREDSKQYMRMELYSMIRNTPEIMDGRT